MKKSIFFAGLILLLASGCGKMEDRNKETNKETKVQEQTNTTETQQQQIVTEVANEGIEGSNKVTLEENKTPSSENKKEDTTHKRKYTLNKYTKDFTDEELDECVVYLKYLFLYDYKKPFAQYAKHPYRLCSTAHFMDANNMKDRREIVEKEIIGIMGNGVKIDKRVFRELEKHGYNIEKIKEKGRAEKEEIDRLYGSKSDPDLKKIRAAARAERAAAIREYGENFRVSSERKNKGKDLEEEEREPKQSELGRAERDALREEALESLRRIEKAKGKKVRKTTSYNPTEEEAEKVERYMRTGSFEEE